MSDIEYDLYVCGVYRGKRKAGTNSILGHLAALNVPAAVSKIGAMINELNAIEGVEASARIEEARKQETGSGD